jgi:hypothetical protein
MQPTKEVVAEQDTAVCEALMRRICDDLGMFLDRPLALESVQASRSTNKVAGERSVHIAFKFGVTVDGVAQHGAILVPLVDAISFACYLMMMTDEVVAQRRKDKDLDRVQKDAMVEVCNLVGGSIDGALRDLYQKRVSARSEGCQGLRVGAAPAFDRIDGVELLVGRAKVKLHTFPSFEILLMLPTIPPAAPAAAA